MIHYFPLERLEQRYTGGMDDAIVRHLLDVFKRTEEPYMRYYPNTDGRAERNPGGANFFHPSATIEFRAKQLALFAEMVQVGNVQFGEIVFLSDLLLPGIDMIGWLNEWHELHLDIRGLVHAGSFTDADMTRRWERWASHYETVAFDLARQVYVGTDFIKHDIISKRLVDPGKLIVTGFPRDPALPERGLPWDQKENLVVFTGRDSPEKQPEMLDELAKAMFGPGGKGRIRVGETVGFVNAVKANLAKDEYHRLLARSKVVVSFALQETYGVGIQEGIQLGCVPVVPNRECYPEMLDERYLYDSFDECCALVQDALDGKIPVPEPINREHAVEEWFAPR